MQCKSATGHIRYNMPHVNSIMVHGVTLVFLLVFCVPFVDASNGDRSYVFEKCRNHCLLNQCDEKEQFVIPQPLHLKLLQWTCRDECKYNCMWETVYAHQKDDSPIPQFFGKWPFIRILGVQEPASMVFSLLNAASHLCIIYYREKVPSADPMYGVWHGMAGVGVVTWLCSAVFHTRDTPLTEKLDYFTAFGLVLYNLFTLVCRVLGSEHPMSIPVAAIPCITLYFYHISCLLVHFDYGYNMKVNIAVGCANALGWLIWSGYHYKQRPYVWKAILVVLGLNVLLLLELGDFPPILWMFDAHAIWHAGTPVLNLLWYSFIVDDALNEVYEERKPQHKKMV